MDKDHKDWCKCILCRWRQADADVLKAMDRLEEIVKEAELEKEMKLEDFKRMTA